MCPSAARARDAPPAPRPAPYARKHRPSLRTLLMQLIPDASTFRRPPKDLDETFIACKVHSTFPLNRGVRNFSRLQTLQRCLAGISRLVSVPAASRRNVIIKSELYFLFKCDLDD